VESQFDPTRIKKAEVVLKDLLGEHGRNSLRDAAVRADRFEQRGHPRLQNRRSPKVKVGQIQFTGIMPSAAAS